TPHAIIVLFAKNFINSKNIYELYKKTNAPVYLLMYDMAPLTGGCHYAWDCKGYQHNCGSCPGLFSSDPFDITFRNLRYRKNYHDKTDLHIVTASEWQYRQTKASTLFKNGRIHKILSSFNQEIFIPVDKDHLRNKLGIPPNKKIILFGANNCYEKRKGMKYLLDSFKILKELVSMNKNLENRVLLLIAGSGFDKKDLLPFDYYDLGQLDNHLGIASAYQAADIFACPSLEDSGPSMINQSIMCGTPVVSFEMGVAIDLILNGKTGYRAKLKDTQNFANGMYSILNMTDAEYKEMANTCRQLALKLYEPSVNINNWLKILNSNK
ncbi:MAG: glycosyltransferase, partial [Ginsengibacter sp.]